MDRAMNEVGRGVPGGPGNGGGIRLSKQEIGLDGHIVHRRYSTVVGESVGMCFPAVWFMQKVPGCGHSHCA